MKPREKQLLILLFIILTGILPGLNAISQNVEINGEPIEISINEYKAGNIQWQFSNDRSNWKNIEGAQSEVLYHKINGNSSFRAKVTDANCSFYSDVTHIESFDFNYRDKNGNPIVSKNSEFVILIPDIQIYTAHPTYQKNLDHIINWILNLNKSGFKIKAVIQVGDVTQNNTIEQWETAHKIFSKLDNIIDYFFCTGNHDYDVGKNIIRHASNLSKYFTYKNNKSFITSYEKNNFENVYFQFKIHDNPFQLFSLEFATRNKVVAWADSIAKANPNSFKMLLTHAYLEKHNVRYNFQKFGLSQVNAIYGWKKDNPQFFNEELNDGEMLWKKLIYPNNHFKFVFCGHQYVATGNLLGIDHNNKEVLQMIYADHRIPEGVSEWIQILEFYDDKKTVGIKTYSTLLNTWKTDSLNQYEFKYNN